MRSQHACAGRIDLVLPGRQRQIRKGFRRWIQEALERELKSLGLDPRQYVGEDRLAAVAMITIGLVVALLPFTSSVFAVVIWPVGFDQPLLAKIARSRNSPASNSP